MTARPPTFGNESWRLGKHIFLLSLLWSPWAWSSGVPWEAKKHFLPQPFMELLSKFLGGSMGGWTQKKCVQLIFKNFEKAKHKFSCIWPLLEFPNSKLRSSKTCQMQINLRAAPIGVFELQDRKFHNMSNANNFFVWPLLELLSSNLESSMLSQVQEIYIRPFLQAFDLWVWKLPHLLNAKNLALAPPWAFEFRAWKLQEGSRQKQLRSTSPEILKLGAQELQERSRQILLPRLSSK